MENINKIYVAGHNGMVGKALISKLKQSGFSKIITANSKNLNLKNQEKTSQFLMDTKPDYVFLIAAKVGGIQANIDNPATYLYDNLMIQSNVINSAKNANVKKLLFIGSSCIYPRLSKQPMIEEYLLNGPLEPTNEAYALAKISGIKLCQYYNKQYNCNFNSVIPPNIFGPNDNFSYNSSHVISALIRKTHEAKIDSKKKLKIWGTGSARREFIYSEDLAEGLIFMMKNNFMEPYINIGSGYDVSIKELAQLIKLIVGYKGTFFWDASKPDGMPQKLMDSSKARKFNWKIKTSLEEGIQKTYQWYLNNLS